MENGQRGKSPCKELGIQFTEALFSVATDPEKILLAVSLGLRMEKDEENQVITTTIPPLAAKKFSDPDSGNSLEFIISQIQEHECSEGLGLSITKIGVDIQIIQHLK